MSDESFAVMVKNERYNPRAVAHLLRDFAPRLLCGRSLDDCDCVDEATKSYVQKTEIYFDYSAGVIKMRYWCIRCKEQLALLPPAKEDRSA